MGRFLRSGPEAGGYVTFTVWSPSEAANVVQDEDFGIELPFACRLHALTWSVRQGSANLASIRARKNSITAASGGTNLLTTSTVVPDDDDVHIRQGSTPSLTSGAARDFAKGDTLILAFTTENSGTARHVTMTATFATTGHVNVDPTNDGSDPPRGTT